MKKILLAFMSFIFILMGTNTSYAVNPPAPNSKLNTGEIDLGGTSIGRINEKSLDLQAELKKILKAFRFGDLGFGLNSIGAGAKVDESKFTLQSNRQGYISIVPKNNVLSGLNKYKHIVFPGGEWSANFTEGDSSLTGEKSFGQLYTGANIGKFLIVAILDINGHTSYITGKLGKNDDYNNDNYKKISLKPNGIVDYYEISDNGEDVFSKAVISITKSGSLVLCARTKFNTDSLSDTCEIKQTPEYKIKFENKADKGKVQSITGIKGILTGTSANLFEITSGCNGTMHLGALCVLKVKAKTNKEYSADEKILFNLEIDYNHKDRILVIDNENKIILEN